jgi:hypothetical protein
LYTCLYKCLLKVRLRGYFMFTYIHEYKTCIWFVIILYSTHLFYRHYCNLVSHITKTLLTILSINMIWTAMCLFYFKLYNFYTKNSNRKMIWKPNKSCSDLQMFFVYFNKLCGLNKIELSCVDFRNLFACSHFTAILQFFILHWFNLSSQTALTG